MSTPALKSDSAPDLRQKRARRGGFDLKHYLEATTQATRRARGTKLALVIASVILFAGIVNSRFSDAAHKRLLLFDQFGQGKIPDSYVKRFIGDGGNKESIKERYQAFYQAYLREYVENRFVVKVPLFGVSFDVNNLGYIGGVGLVILLIMYQYSLSRELDNLRKAFKQARLYPGQLGSFYELLAMEQVLTLPPSEDIAPWRRLLLMTMQKVLTFCPAAA